MSKQKLDVLGESYFLRPTFDIIDDADGIHGFDVYDDAGNFLSHYDISVESELTTQIKWDFYKVAK